MGKFKRVAVLGMLLGASLSVWAKDEPCANALTKAPPKAIRPITYRALPKPEVTNRYPLNGRVYEKTEVAEIMAVDDPQMQKLIDHAHAMGGQVRLMKSRIRGGIRRWSYESPYFWVNLDESSPSFLTPVIAIDIGQPRALASLSHEMQHLEIWFEHFQRALSEGLDRESATRRAIDEVLTLDMIVYGEKRAVMAELTAERDHANNPYNRPYEHKRPSLFWEEGYVNRITYPQFEAMRVLLRDHPGDVRLDQYALEMVKTAYDTREAALKYMPVGAEGRAHWEESSLFDLLIQPFGDSRLKSEGTYRAFEEKLRQTEAEFLESLAN